MRGSKFRYQIGLKGVVLAALLFTTACGSNPSVSNMLGSIAAKAYVQEGDIWAQVSAKLVTSSYLLGSLSIPLRDPGTGIEYGRISIVPVICPAGSACINSGQLEISVDVTKAAQLKTISSSLPNGTAFPLALPSDAQVVAIPIGSAGAKLYVALGSQTIMVGTAIPFSALNGVGQYVAGVNVFETVNLGNVTSYIGIFAGAEHNQTGVGLIADLSKLLNVAPAAVSSQILASRDSASIAIDSVSASVEAAAAIPARKSRRSAIRLNASNASDEDRDELFYQLYRHGKHKPVLTYE